MYVYMSMYIYLSIYLSIYIYISPLPFEPPSHLPPHPTPLGHLGILSSYNAEA